MAVMVARISWSNVEYFDSAMVSLRCTSALLQGLTWFSATQTGCRWLISYIEQKQFLACGPEFSVEFSAPPEFSGGVWKSIEHRVGANLRSSDYEPDVLPLRHCSLVCKMQWHLFCSLLEFSSHFCSYWKPNFQAVSGSYLPGFSGRICSYWQPNFLAVSVVTCRKFLALPFLAPEGRDFPAASVVSGRDFPAVAFLSWVI